MLGAALLAVRLGGIYALEQLAVEYPERFLRPIVGQYCAFVRHPPEGNGRNTDGKGQMSGADSETLREDVGAVMNFIMVFSFEPKTRAVLKELSLDLSGAILSGADLSPANLQNANLSGAQLGVGGLPASTGFSTPNLAPVHELTQDQLDHACADPQDPPDLSGAAGQEGVPLEWREKPCEEQGR